MCSSAAIAALVDECIADAGTVDACQQWQSTYAACSNCIIGEHGAIDPQTGEGNVAGCIALVTNDSTNAGCAAKWTTAGACTDQACASCDFELETKQCFSTVTSATDAGYCHDSVAAQCDPTSGGFGFCFYDAATDFAAWTPPFVSVFCGPDLDAATDAPDDALDAGAADAPD